MLYEVITLDNPSLTVRNWSGKNPIRIALDRQGKIPASYHLKDGVVKTYIFTTKEKQDKNHLQYIKIDFDEECLKTILTKIYEKNIHSVLVEGGSQLLRSFIKAGLWDEANVEVSPQKVEKGIEAPQLPVLSIKRATIEGHEWLFYQNPQKPFSL